MQTSTDDDGIRVFRRVLKDQYHGALAMLRQTIEKCPQELWIDKAYTNPFWRIAYHALFYCHLYSQPRAQDFRPWKLHQTSIQDLDDIPAPPDILDVIELPHRPPQTGEPYSKTQVLEYLTFCEDMIDAAVDRLDLLSLDSGFHWSKRPKAERQIVNIRHIQHHTAQLAVRLRESAGIGIDWIGGRT